MKKKLSCLILSVMLALTSLFTVSCTVSNTDKDEETDKTTTSRNPMTLTLWIPTDESTTSEAISQVESALNKITQPKYNTAIELHAISSDKYEDSVNARMEEINEIQTRTEEEERARKKQSVKLARTVKPSRKQQSLRKKPLQVTLPEKVLFLQFILL